MYNIPLYILNIYNFVNYILKLEKNSKIWKVLSGEKKIFIQQVKKITSFVLNNLP